MATSKKVTELPTINAASNSDVLYIVHDPAGVPVSNKITVQNLLKDSTSVVLAANAYSNSVVAATSLAGNAYSNAVAAATSLAGNAYSNSIVAATALAGNAYSNAISAATALAGNAYSNAVSAATALAGNAYSNAVSAVTSLAGNAYTNSIAVAASLAGNAYTNAVAYVVNSTAMLSPNIAYTGTYNQYPARLSLSKGRAILLTGSNSTVVSTPQLYWLSDQYSVNIDGVETLDFINIGGFEANVNISAGITINLRDAVAIMDVLSIVNAPNLTTFNANSVVYVNNINLESLDGVNTQFNFPNLKVAGDIIYQLNDTHENTPQFPSLESVEFSINFNNNSTTIDAITFDSLEEVNTIEIYLNSGMVTSPAFPSLIRINDYVDIYDNVNMLTPPSFPLLETIFGNFAIYGNGITTAPATPSLVSIGGNINLSENASMVNGLDFSSLKSVTGDVYFNGCALDETSVNYILTTLASLDGTNGTTSYDSNVIDISGGTNAIPTGAGLAAITTLEARGCTVNRNT